MQIYMVGGAVRDKLLGRPVNDHDWVVVGATPEQMLELGYLPVGRDFPVFLHPETREEYALARTERKSGRGYRGFVVESSPDVTLEEELSRRDLTINAIATSAYGTSSGGIFDPYSGAKDIEARVLRHVTDAFREDPVRILRVARFAARFTDFTVAPETIQLMREMVAHGEVDHLVAERVWQELARGLMEEKPSRMFEVLRECGVAIRKPGRFADILLACECDARGRLGFEESAYPQRQRLAAVLAAVQSVGTGDTAAQAAAKGVAGPQTGAVVHQARVEAVAQWLQPRSDVA